MTLEQYEKEKAAIMAEYIREKQSVTYEYSKRTAIVEHRYRESEEDYRAASRRYSDSIIEIKNWFAYELAELKKQVLKEEAESEGGYLEIQEIRNRHSERVTELIEKKHEKIELVEIEFHGAKVARACAGRDWRIGVCDIETIRRKAIDEAKKVMCENLKELAGKMHEEVTL